MSCALENMIGFGTILKENRKISWVACLKQYFMRAPRTPVISINATHHHTDNDDHLLSGRLSNAHMWILLSIITRAMMMMFVIVEFVRLLKRTVLH